MLAALAAAALLAACGKGSTTMPDTWEVSVSRAGSAWMAKDLPRVYALCENAFVIAHKARDAAKAATAVQCLTHAAAERKEIAKAAPHLRNE